MSGGFGGLLGGEGTQAGWLLVLNRYQRDNLLWLLNVVETVRPFCFANTGDWVGEIANMISLGWPREPKSGDQPNIRKEDLVRSLEAWARNGAKVEFW